MAYQYRTAPYAHQREWFERSKDAPVFALFMEQGTGKTKVLLDTAAYLFERRAITGVLVLADNGVHANWITDELPAHFPWDRINTCTHIWRSGSATTKRVAADLAALLTYPGLSVLAMNIESVITLHGALTIRAFLKARRTLMIVDESTLIKTPKAKRTRACVALGAFAPYRRIASGTPFAESPLDAYAQFTFLDRRIIGHTSFYAFKHEFATWVPQRTGSGQRYEVLATDRNNEPMYKNLDVLRARIDPHCCFVFKKDCLDLPEKVYQRRPFALAPEQRRLYNQLREEYLLELSKDEVVPVRLVLTRMLRLQQIASGFVPDFGEDEPATRALGANERLTTLLAVLAPLSRRTKVIVWCRFRADVTHACVALRETYGDESVVRYDGSVKAEDREAGKARFQSDPRARFFVGTARAGGRGLTLTAASVVIFYSNDPGLERRLQAEDRAHRIGQTNKVTYIDLIATDTVDEGLVARLRAKRKLSATISRQELGEWL